MPKVLSQFKCTSCGEFDPACGFYANERLLRGHLSICVSCHKKRTVESRREKNAGVERVDGRKNRPKMSDEESLEANRRRSRKSYYKDINKSREYSRKKAREYTAKFPERKRATRLKEKYGLTIEAWNQLFESQGRMCAICGATDPGTSGWNTDHCHSSGSVRFILCCHCNRGLGAFKDDPNLMRRAAKMLEEIKNDPV